MRHKWLVCINNLEAELCSGVGILQAAFNCANSIFPKCQRERCLYQFGGGESEYLWTGIRPMNTLAHIPGEMDQVKFKDILKLLLLYYLKRTAGVQFPEIVEQFFNLFVRQ